MSSTEQNNVIDIKTGKTKEESLTDRYVVSQVLYTHTPLKTTPDIMNGGQRNKRWGAIAAFGVIPGLDNSPEGPAVLPIPPTQFFASDDLEDLRTQVVAELDKAISLAKLAVEDPAEFERQQRELSMQVRREQQKLDDENE